MRSFVRGLFWIAAIVGAIGLLLQLFVVDGWVVPGDDPMLSVSIEPTLRPGDRVLVQRGAIPKVGQLARCLSPQSGSYVVGRVFGGPGDTVELRNESVVANGRAVVARHGCTPVKLLHPVTGREVELSCAVEDNGAWTYETLVQRDYPENAGASRVEPDKLYLVSDNRHLHLDSRNFGQVDAASCEHVVYRLWGDTYADGSRRFTILW